MDNKIGNDSKRHDSDDADTQTPSSSDKGFKRQWQPATAEGAAEDDAFVPAPKKSNSMKASSAAQQIASQQSTLQPPPPRSFVTSRIDAVPQPQPQSQPHLPPPQQQHQPRQQHTARDAFLYSPRNHRSTPTTDSHSDVFAMRKRQRPAAASLRPNIDDAGRTNRKSPPTTDLQRRPPLPFPPTWSTMRDEPQSIAQFQQKSASTMALQQHLFQQQQPEQLQQELFQQQQEQHRHQQEQLFQEQKSQQPLQQQYQQMLYNAATTRRPTPHLDTATSDIAETTLAPESIAAMAMAANMRSAPMFQLPQRPMQYPIDATTLSNRSETLNWSHHHNSSTIPVAASSLSRAESMSPSTLQQLTSLLQQSSSQVQHSHRRDDHVSLLPMTTLTRQSSQPPLAQREGDHDASSFGPGDYLRLPPLDYSSLQSLSWSTSQRSSTDSFPVIAATTTASAAAAKTLQRQSLPALLTCPTDGSVMSEHQAYLRRHIEVFGATVDDVMASVRGRTKPIAVGQVGIQCRHCRHVPMSNRINGAVYFPATTLEIYQAAQNMSAMHLQCGRCPHMPDSDKQRFVELLPTKNLHSKVGRKYWAERAVEMFGLVDTDNGIFVLGTNQTTSMIQVATRLT